MSPNRRLIIWSLLLTASMLGLAILNLSTGTMTIKLARSAGNFNWSR
ncbi:hypothetical protein AWA2013_25510 [Lactiplantibacillus plantarum]|nr:hypothetical protein [Lactiplantibacillus plantarum]BEI51145.1 hypothetical protein AWA2013_25510 [Lactiplantibacillus plantarum]